MRKIVLSTKISVTFVNIWVGYLHQNFSFVVFVFLHVLIQLLQIETYPPR